MKKMMFALAFLLGSFVFVPAYADASVLYLQSAAASNGHEPGPLDGLWGSRTATAVKKLVADKEIEGVDINNVTSDDAASIAAALEENAREVVPPGVLFLNYGPGSLDATTAACLSIENGQQSTSFVFGICDGYEVGDMIYAGVARPYLAGEDEVVFMFKTTETSPTFSFDASSHLKKLQAPIEALEKSYVPGVELVYVNGFEQMKGFNRRELPEVLEANID